MTADEVKAELVCLCGQDWERELAPIVERLQRLDSEAAFCALFPFAAHSQSAGPAAPAAWLLRRINPKCPLSCQEAIREMLKDWDVSIEEVPFYLAEQFGRSVVQAIVAGLRTTTGDKVQLTLLDTIDYWLGCYQEMHSRQSTSGEV